jgi:hypothetical protein
VDAAFVLAVVAILGFAFTNGFHDAANAIATLVATRGASPGAAIILAAVCNMLGPLLLGAAVADTIAGIVEVTPAQTVIVVGAALTAAVIWNLVTWRWGLPSSSSHALVGGLVGAAVVEAGIGAVNWGGVGEGIRPGAGRPRRRQPGHWPIPRLSDQQQRIPHAGRHLRGSAHATDPTGRRDSDRPSPAGRSGRAAEPPPTDPGRRRDHRGHRTGRRTSGAAAVPGPAPGVVLWLAAFLGWRCWGSWSGSSWRSCCRWVTSCVEPGDRTTPCSAARTS